MYKIFLLAKNSLKKNLKHILAFSIILLISTILFSSALVIKNNIDKDYEKKFEKLNTANVFFNVPAFQYKDSILDDIKKLDSVKEVSVREGIVLEVPVEINDAEQTQNQIFYNILENNNISKYNIVEETNDNLNHSIYIPYYIYANSNMKLKDEFSFKVNDKKYTFLIKGVIEEMQYTNYSSSIIGNYLTSDSYDYLAKDNEVKKVKSIALISKDSNKTYDEVTKILTDSKITILNRNYDSAFKQSKLSVSNILVLILLVFSIIMLLISLLVSKFKIKNNIEEDMTNMGVLEAIGYTSGGIIASIIMPYILAGIIFTTLGIGLSYLVIPVLADVISKQAGFVWNPNFDIISGLIVFIINVLLITIFANSSAKKIKKLNPINAIRGIAENKKTKNSFRIDKTKGSINFILALKNFATTKGQNFLLGIVLFFITVLASFIGILFYNVNVNPMNFVNTLVEEHPSVLITSNKDLREEIKKLDNVKDAIYYDENISVVYKDSTYKTFVSESYDDLANDLSYLGRNPENENEVSVGSAIREKYDLNIDDKITLTKDDVSKEFTVTGFIQSVNYSGEVIEMTLDGYKKLDSNYEPKTIYIYLNDEKESTNFIEKLEDKFGDDILSNVNYVESMESATDMFISLIKIISIVMIIISLIIIYLILYILISSIIFDRRQELGILKSVGYVNKDLIIQLIGGFMPSTILFSIVGLIIGKIFMSSIYESIFKMVGAYRVSFEYPIFIFMIITVALIISTILIGILLARKIKKISVYELIKD